MTNRERMLIAAAIRFAYEEHTESINYQMGVQFTAQAIAQALLKADRAFNIIQFLIACGMPGID